MEWWMLGWFLEVGFCEVGAGILSGDGAVKG